MFVFISYRRSDTRHVAGRLKDHLGWERGVEEVFLDTQSIQPGEAFPARIAQALHRATHVLVFIGPGWVARRLFEPDDFVRREIAMALASASAVIPVLVDGASLPSAEEVPEELRPLLDRQHFVIHNDKGFPDEIKPLLTHLLGREPVGGDTLGTVALKVALGAGMGLLAFLAVSAFVQFVLRLDAASLFAFTDAESAQALWQLLLPGFALGGALALPLLRRRWRLGSRAS